MGRGLILAQVVLLTAFAVCSSSSVVKKEVHSDGTKDFTIVKHIKKNQCTCSCKCVPDSPSEPPQLSALKKILGHGQPNTASEETVEVDTSSETGDHHHHHHHHHYHYQEGGATSSSEDKYDGGVRNGTETKEVDDSAQLNSTETGDAQQEVNKDNGTGRESGEDRETTEDIESATTAVIEAHTTAEGQKEESESTPEAAESTNTSGSSTIESVDGANATDASIEEVKTTADVGVTKAVDGEVPDVSTVETPEQSEASETAATTSEAPDSRQSTSTSDQPEEAGATGGIEEKSNGTEVVTEKPAENEGSTQQGIEINFSTENPTAVNATGDSPTGTDASTNEPAENEVAKENEAVSGSSTEEPIETDVTTETSLGSESPKDEGVESHNATEAIVPTDEPKASDGASEQQNGTDAATVPPKLSYQSTAESITAGSGSTDNTQMVDATAVADADKEDETVDTSAPPAESATDKEAPVPESTTESAVTFHGSFEVVDKAENVSNVTAESDNDLLLTSATEKAPPSGDDDSAGSTAPSDADGTSHTTATEGSASTASSDGHSVSQEEKEGSTNETVSTETVTTDAGSAAAESSEATKQPAVSSGSPDANPDVSASSSSLNNITELNGTAVETDKQDSLLNATGTVVDNSVVTDGPHKAPENSEAPEGPSATTSGEALSGSSTTTEKTSSSERQPTTTESSGSTTDGSEEDETSDEDDEEDDDEETTTDGGLENTTQSGSPVNASEIASSSVSPESQSPASGSSTEQPSSKEEKEVATSSESTDSEKEDRATTEEPKTTDANAQSVRTSDDERSATSAGGTQAEKEGEEKDGTTPASTEEKKGDRQESDDDDKEHENSTTEAPGETAEGEMKDLGDLVTANETEVATAEVPVTLLLKKEGDETSGNHTLKELIEEGEPNPEEVVTDTGRNETTEGSHSGQNGSSNLEDREEDEHSSDKEDVSKESEKEEDSREGRVISTLEKLRGKEALALGLEIPQLGLRTTKKVITSAEDNEVTTSAPSSQHKESGDSHEEGKHQKQKANVGDGSFVMETKHGDRRATATPLVNDGNEKIRQGWRDALERLRQKLRAHREHSGEKKVAVSKEDDGKKDTLSEASKESEEEDENSERHLYLVQVVKDKKQTPTPKPADNKKDESKEASKETSSESDKSGEKTSDSDKRVLSTSTEPGTKEDADGRAEVQTKAEALVGKDDKDGKVRAEGSSETQDHEKEEDDKVPAKKADESGEEKLRTGEDGRSFEAKKILGGEKPAKQEQKATPEFAFSIDEPSEDGLRQGMSFAVDSRPNGMAPSISDNGRPAQLFNSWRTPATTESEPINAKSLREKMAEERDIALLKQQEMARFNREEGHRIKEQQVRARFSAQEERLYELELNASNEEKEKEIHEARKRLEKARLLREEQLKIDRLREVSSPEEQRTLMERREQISRQLDQLTKRERIHHQNIAHREIDQQTRARAVQTAIMNALTNANGSVFGAAPESNDLVKSLLIRASPDITTQAPAPAPGPMPPATGGGLHLDKPQCDAIRKFARVFQMTKPVEWVRQNCAFAQQYFPKLTCPEIQELFESCIGRS